MCPAAAPRPALSHRVAPRRIVRVMLMRTTSADVLVPWRAWCEQVCMGSLVVNAVLIHRLCAPAGLHN